MIKKILKYSFIFIVSLSTVSAFPAYALAIPVPSMDLDAQMDNYWKPCLKVDELYLYKAAIYKKGMGGGVFTGQWQEWQNGKWVGFNTYSWTYEGGQWGDLVLPSRSNYRFSKPGTYYIRFVADYKNTINETNENNNYISNVTGFAVKVVTQGNQCNAIE